MKPWRLQSGLAEVCALLNAVQLCGANISDEMINHAERGSFVGHDRAV